jgi:hypothetical protein
MVMAEKMTDRVQRNTSKKVNERIASQTEVNIARLAHARSYEIEQRLAGLEEEWDIERYLETMAPSFTLFGLGMGVTVNKKWLLLPLVIQSFFLQHALQGWCPPVPVLRRLGIRTRDEIDREKYALKALRGDFRQIAEEVTDSNRKAAAIAAVEL